MDKVNEFAEFVGVGVEAWMQWDGWESWVGYDACASDGPQAPCWGYAGCHGYLQGCGCSRCVDREQKETEEAG